MLIQFMNQCLWWMLYIDFIFNHLLKKETTFLFVTIKYTNQDWKCHQFINYGNNIEKKNTEIYWNEILFFCEWKIKSITSSMRLKYKTGIYKIKKSFKISTILWIC